MFLVMRIMKLEFYERKVTFVFRKRREGILCEVK